MHPGLLNVLHNRTNDHILAVGYGIDVCLDGVIKKAIEQHWRIIGNLNCVLHIVSQLVFVVDDFHSSSAQYIGGTYYQRVADFFRQTNTIFNATSGAVRWLFQAQLVDHLLEALSIFCFVDRIRTGTNNRHAGCLQGTSQLQWGLSTILDNHPFRLLDVTDFKHILQGDRLKEQPIGSIIIRGHGFRITVDHDGLVTVFSHRQCCVHTAIIKLDTLTNTVRTTTQHHDIFTTGGIGLALFIVCRAHIGSIGGELCRTGIHALVNWSHTKLMTAGAQVRFLDAQQPSKTGIGKAFTL